MLISEVGLSVAKVAKCMLRENNKFMLVFDLTVAEVAEVAGFSNVPEVGCVNVCGWMVFECTRDLMLIFVLSVAKVANCMLRENYKFMLDFVLTVAEVAEVAGFSGVAVV